MGQKKSEDGFLSSFVANNKSRLRADYEKKIAHISPLLKSTALRAYEAALTDIKAVLMVAEKDLEYIERKKRPSTEEPKDSHADKFNPDIKI